MQYKDILLYIDDGASNAERVKAAFELAKAHQAKITGITLSALTPDRENILYVNPDKISPQQCAQQRIDEFLACAVVEGIQVGAKIISDDRTSAVRKLAQFARNFDLVMLRQANPEKENSSLVGEIAEQVILLSGRPVLFMPYIGAHHIPFKRAIIAWDGTPAVTRAVHDARPLLAGLDEVIILIIEGNKKTAKGELLADEMRDHLKNHGINAVVSRRNAGSMDVPTILLNEIADNDVDVLIMGGYGTPNIRQKIFGGVTRTILSTMVVPVLMSH